MRMIPTYEEMENKVRALEKEASTRNRTEELLRESEEKSGRYQPWHLSRVCEKTLPRF